MKEKLKTLKDFEAKREHKCFIDYDEDCIGCERNNVIDELKAEAIKWVKDIENNMMYPAPKGLENMGNGKFFIIDWIKYYANLTDEDLK